MPFNINHIHIKSNDPEKSANWWVEHFNFKIVSDTVRPGDTFGDRFIACDSENGVRVNITGVRNGEKLGPGDANIHEGIEHFGIDSADIEADIARLQKAGATLLDGPLDGGAILMAFFRCPDNVRLELIQRK